MKLTAQKRKYLENLSDENGFISALAIDQRGALKKMLNKHQASEATAEQIKEFKVLVSKHLTKYSSSILLDPEYGLRLKEEGADAVKFLLYYDVDESDEINNQKRAYMERVGAECVAEDIPFFLEILSYNYKDADNSTAEFAKLKPRKVIEAMKEFSKPRYNVDVLKVEVPVNMKYVEGFADGEVVYTKEEAASYFKQQDEATNLPYIYLSAGVSAKLFQDTLKFAHDSGAKFNGVLCGRATWANGVEVFAKDGEEATVNWLNTVGRKNIEELNEVVAKTATSWKEK